MSLTKQLRDDISFRVENCEQSLNSIAKKSGIPCPVLWRFARGERDLTLRTADKLIAFLGWFRIPTARQRLESAVREAIKERWQEAKAGAGNGAIEALHGALVDQVEAMIEKEVKAAIGKIKRRKQKRTA